MILQQATSIEMRKRMALCCCVAFLSFGSVSAQQTFQEKFCNAAISLTKQRVVYDPSYFSISYPNGDVPEDRGVCTDVVIRAYRKLGIDLQKLVHEDMKRNFNTYPKNWGLRATDKNIDHRRVPNLMTFFSRHGKQLKTSKKNSDYEPGDIVTWDLDRGTPHIGIVIPSLSADGQRYLIVHNIGSGQEVSDCLFSYRITGHYRYPANN
jgi:uncharacterized protein YijF (DUF1287 family)